MTRTLTAVKLHSKSHKGKNVLAAVRRAHPAWEGWWRIVARGNFFQPDKFLVAPVLPDGKVKMHFVRWVSTIGCDQHFSWDLAEAVWEPAGEVRDAEGSGTQA